MTIRNTSREARVKGGAHSAQQSQESVMHNEPPSSTRPADAERSDRLDSWKDVAAYLKRDVSTVQRWEKREGMPVHRHVHDKLGSVYAFRSELDAWWRGRGARVAQQEADRLPMPTAAAPDTNGTTAGRMHDDLGGRASRPETRRTRRRVAAISLAALGVVLIIGLFLTSGRTARRDISAPPTSPARSSSGAESVSPAAYDLVQQARYLSVRTTDADNRAAIALLEEAIRVDPAFAVAYAELASAYIVRFAYVMPDQTRELEQKAFSAAEKAVSLDPRLPQAYIARGDLLWTPANRFAHERATKEFRRALELNPGSDQAHQKLARVYVHVGFFEEAVQHAEKALSINPSNAQALNSRAQAILWSGHDEEALSILQGIPGPVLPELVEANTVFALHRLGRREEAWSHLQRALRKHPEDANGNLRGMEAVLRAESEPQRAQELIDGVARRKTGNPSHHAAYFAGCASARMRKAVEAVRLLREAAATGFPCYSLFARDPNLDPIRQEPVFQAFMADMKKDSASLRKALSAAQ
jgi:tetratricopeptide (TPR) repeat protein